MIAGILTLNTHPCSLPCLPSVSCPLKAVHLHRVHNIDLFCRGVYYLRTSLLLCSKNKELERHVAAGAGAASDKRGNGKRGNAGGNDAGELQVETHGIPYMCLAQCEDMGTTVAHRKVPPLKVRCGSRSGQGGPDRRGCLCAGEAVGTVGETKLAWHVHRYCRR